MISQYIIHSVHIISPHNSLLRVKNVVLRTNKRPCFEEECRWYFPRVVGFIFDRPDISTIADPEPYLRDIIFKKKWENSGILLILMKFSDELCVRWITSFSILCAWWVSEWYICLTPSDQCFSYVMTRTSYISILWNRLCTKTITNRHVAPLGHIILISNQPVQLLNVT